MMSQYWVPGYLCFIVYLFIWIVVVNTTPTPTIIDEYCNIFNGKTMDNIVLQENYKISDLVMTDSLRIAFNFVITSVTACASDECNLMQFGVTDESILFPRISIVDTTDTSFTWKIRLQMGTDVDETINTTMTQTFPYSSSFDISISTDIRRVVIGSDIVYSDSTVISIPSQTGYHPLYISSPCCTALDANITQLCVSTDSSAPTPFPTKSPTTFPTTSLPTKAPTKSPTDSIYTKIDCYTETGNAGDTTIECALTDYFPTSCGVQRDATVDYDTVFFRGWYIARNNPNNILTEKGICHIEYDITDTSVTGASLQIKPVARCCNFKQQYGDSFQCRYFNSADVITGTNTYNQTTSESAATVGNEFSYVSCNDNYPVLLGCTATIIEPYDVPSSISTQSYFYGSFLLASDYYYQYYTIFPNETIQYAPTTYQPTSYGYEYTPSPTPASVTEIKFDISITTPYTPCVAQYGSTTRNYSVIAIATCCTESYSQSTDCCTEPTLAPTAMPTISPLVTTETYGRGVNIGDSFEETGTNGPITAITEWGIAQVLDTQGASDKENYIPYQGILINQYEIYNYETSEIEQFTADSDYGQWSTSDEFILHSECANFELDTIDGQRDYINGFDVYFTRFAIFGIRFYTKFDRVYTCPDDQSMSDTSIDWVWDDPFGDRPTNDDDDFKVRTNDYNISNVSSLATFDENGTYQLSGWKGVKQTRELASGLDKSVMAQIAFIFLLDPAAAPTATPTNAPTSPPTPLPQPTSVPTASPTLYGQAAIGEETLQCYSIWDEAQISCKDHSNDTMTACHGFSVTNQVFSTYIDDTTTSSTCNAETIDDVDEVAAVAVCCYFFIKSARDYNIFLWVTITGAVLYSLVLFGIGIHWCFFNRVKVYFNESDIDKDSVIDDAWENIGHEEAEEKVENFKVRSRDYDKMVEMQKQISDSPGLEAD